MALPEVSRRFAREAVLMLLLRARVLQLVTEQTSRNQFGVASPWGKLASSWVAAWSISSSGGVR